MKKILICGKGSYIGKTFIKKMSTTFKIDELDLRNNWDNFDFSNYDVLIHLAAIVHQPEINNDKLYFKVNRDLPISVASKAASQGLKHFIFFSTMGVYGISPSLYSNGKVSINSGYDPKNLYGLSKLQAEIGLVNLLKMSSMNLSIVRPPNVYGKSCPGNYYRYMQLCAKYSIVFPLLRHNKFSMISAEHLCSELEKIIKNKTIGIICPQDTGNQSNAVRISNMAKEYQRFHYQSKIFGKLLYLIYKIYPFKQITNLFGDLFYDETLLDSVSFDDAKYKS